jgi:hypothetical protein
MRTRAEAAAGASTTGLGVSLNRKFTIFARLLALRALIEVLKAEVAALVDEASNSKSFARCSIIAFLILGLDASESRIDDEEAAARVAEACRLLGVGVPRSAPDPVEESEDPTSPTSDGSFPTPAVADPDEGLISEFDDVWNRRRSRPHARWLPGEYFPEGEIFWDAEQQDDDLGMSQDEWLER